MLKELVTSIFCCLPHHHETPVERITPISVVSEEPYDRHRYGKAMRDGLYEQAYSMACRGVVDENGISALNEIDELAEQYAQRGRNADDLVFKGILFFERNMHAGLLPNSCYYWALQSRRKDLAIKSMFLKSSCRDGAMALDEKEYLLEIIEENNA